jgi:hypothetical protein
MDPYGRVIGFLDWSCYFFIQVAPQTPFQTYYFSEILVLPGIEPGISGSVAMNSDHYTTEVVK